ncbi:ABC transporter ATP-binding protein [Paramicrobacterium fandaimingii]|uniref:ABC transporter ATP-binding protein n=1 Tax=Paramicrobacterium fandaimingii TaxID=2708079 RepID=UPI001AB05062|nr:ABC transporter ATP-binding protein [Microbacterium fandaimingii]
MTTQRDQENVGQASDVLLKVSDLNVSYGRVHVLQDVSFEMGSEPVGMLGRNGMGKSTLVNTIAGFIPAQSGTVEFDGVSVLRRQPYQINRAGIAYVPQGRRIFPSLSVHEHLTMVGGSKNGRWNVESVYDLFPRLAERRKSGGADLSGGEQQMLAIARALLSNPRLIIMDEPSEGLAPAVVDNLATVFRDLVSEGQSVLLVEQNLRFATELCDRILIMVNGHITADLSAHDVASDKAVQSKYLGVS